MATYFPPISNLKIIGSISVANTIGSGTVIATLPSNRFCLLNVIFENQFNSSGEVYLYVNGVTIFRRSLGSFIHPDGTVVLGPSQNLTTSHPGGSVVLRVTGVILEYS